jgi:hypothetical protein
MGFKVTEYQEEDNTDYMTNMNAKVGDVLAICSTRNLYVSN